jgi:ABC-type nickel/cobalt efflux system permease component RcnA
MLILGLLLVVLSGAAAALLIAYNNGGAEQTITLFGRDLVNVTAMEAFVAGVVTALVFVLGVWMIMSAGRRARENRARYREARKEAKVAARERDELAEQLRHDEEQRHEQEQEQEQEPTVAMSRPPMQRDSMGGTTDTMITPPPAAPSGARHAASPERQQVITNITPGQSPTR